MTHGRPDTIELEVQYISRRNRLTVFFRIILAIPQLIVLIVLGVASLVVAIIGWFAALVLGRLPRWVADFNGGVLAWWTRVYAYLYFLVDRYPPFAWTSHEDYPVRVRLAPGRLNRLTVLFRIILAIPAYVLGYLAIFGLEIVSVVVWLILVIGGRMPKALFEALVAVMRYWTRFEGYAVYLLTGSYPKGLFNEPLAVGGELAQPGAVDGAPSEAFGATGTTGAFGASDPSTAQVAAPAWQAFPSPRSTASKVLVAVFMIIGLLAFVASLTQRTTNSTTSPPTTTATAFSAGATSRDGRFMTAIPSGFRNGIAYAKNEPIALLYVALGPRSGGFTTNVNVIRETSHGLTDINTITRAELSTLRTLQPPPQQVSSQTLTVGGDPARTLDYQRRLPSRPLVLHDRQVFVEHQGWIYIITYSALSASYSASLHALTQVINSWRWT